MKVGKVPYDKINRELAKLNKQFEDEMKVDHDEWLPTVCFGFQLLKGKEVLHQMWVTPLGKTEWRPVPMLEIGKTAKEVRQTVAGYLEDDDE